MVNILSDSFSSVFCYTHTLETKVEGENRINEEQREGAPHINSAQKYRIDKTARTIFVVAIKSISIV